MSDFAQGFIVLGATRTHVRKWLKQWKLPAFVAKGPGKALRVWPRVEGTEAEAAASGLSSELPAGRVLFYATRDDGLHVSVHVGGVALAREEVALRLKTAKMLSQAHAALQRVAAALDFSGRLPSLLRDGPSRPTFLALVGVKDEDVALLHYGLLAEARLHPEAPEASRFEDFTFSDGEKTGQPFFDAKAAEQGASSGAVDLRACTSFRDWVDTSRRVEPASATPEVVSALADAVGGAPRFELTPEREQTLRETAARLLGSVAKAREEAREGIVRQALEGLRTAATPALRAAWAQVLQAVPPDERTRAALTTALQEETDLEALRQLFTAYAHLGPQTPDTVLLKYANAPPAHERKGAYALLEKTESTAAVVALRERLPSEEDAAAREVLQRVVTTLTSL